MAFSDAVYINKIGLTKHENEIVYEHRTTDTHTLIEKTKKMYVDARGVANYIDFINGVDMSFWEVHSENEPMGETIGKFSKIEGLQIKTKEGVTNRDYPMPPIPYDNLQTIEVPEGSSVIALEITLDDITEKYIIVETSTESNVSVNINYSVFRKDLVLERIYGYDRNSRTDLMASVDSTSPLKALKKRMKYGAIRIATRDFVKRFYMFDQD